MEAAVRRPRRSTRSGGARRLQAPRHRTPQLTACLWRSSSSSSSVLGSSSHPAVSRPRPPPLWRRPRTPPLAPLEAPARPAAPAARRGRGTRAAPLRPPPPPPPRPPPAVGQWSSCAATRRPSCSAWRWRRAARRPVPPTAVSCFRRRSSSSLAPRPSALLRASCPRRAGGAAGRARRSCAGRRRRGCRPRRTLCSGSRRATAPAAVVAVAAGLCT